MRKCSVHLIIREATKITLHLSLAINQLEYGEGTLVHCWRKCTCVHSSTVYSSQVSMDR